MGPFNAPDLSQGIFMTISTSYSVPSTVSTVLPVPKSNNTERSNVWAVILAGGGRLPIRSSVPLYPGGQLLTQFHNTEEFNYVINQTREKVALAVPPERTMIAVSANHLNYADHVLGEVPCKNLVIGPEDDGTIFAILCSLFRVRGKDPNATVVFFPADLNVPDANSLMSCIHDAVEAVHRRPRLILLGIEPTGDEQNREWIKPDLSAPIHEDLMVAKVNRLLSKVTSHEVRELIRRGGLWNSSVMVGRIWTFLRKIRRVRPDLYTTFKAAEPMIGT